MKIVKESRGGGSAAVTGEDMTLINALARKELTAEEVYTFSVRLCDNEVDRDMERFSTATLEGLAPMFVGKSGIFDHQWTARGQSARIYRTEIVREQSRLTRAGEVYCWLKGYAYMLRGEQTRPLIDEIEGGIKKEVSVGCSVAAKICSVCGADLEKDSCPHKKGEFYDGKLCYAGLEGAVDAYEFSFVAVPAQPAAGVVKGLEPECADLKALAERHPVCAGQLKVLEEQAAMGRTYRKLLEEEVVRLGLLAGLELEAETLGEMAREMPFGRLEELKKAWGRQAGKRYPLKTQLEYGERTTVRQDADRAFLI